MRLIKEVFSGLIGVGVGLLCCGLWSHNPDLLWGAGWTIGIAIFIRIIIHSDDE